MIKVPTCWHCEICGLTWRYVLNEANPLNLMRDATVKTIFSCCAGCGGEHIESKLEGEVWPSFKKKEVRNDGS